MPFSSLDTGPVRRDILLALAITFHEPQAAARGPAGAGEVLSLFSAAPAAERQALSRRHEWYRTLPPQEQRHWLRHTLEGARGNSAASRASLDEHLSPSHIAAALESEPARVRALVLGRLPASLAEPAASALAAGGAEAAGATHGLAGVTPDRKILSLLESVTLSRFVTRDMLRSPSALDDLSAAEMVRLARLLGAREVALACRGVANVESVAAFIRRFPAEEARAIITYLTAPADVEPPRIAHAERLLGELLGAGTEPDALINEAGMHLLALALSGREPAAAAYALQKFPVHVERGLSRLIAEANARGDEGAARPVAAEVEFFAASLLRARPSPRETARG